ncbi:hypothetical protein EV421DRAFT_1708093 [Armillaria borealis]|uniref:Integrase core domain-containing protein n=1 Tax=Armillaria borealis TaxID=47425 RepID=A0AA39JN42_9AGAR|nr:hypothetical protein EV421DRAFT_1708093 [Armillaria borealis]
MLPWYVLSPSCKSADRNVPVLRQHQARFPAAEYATLQDNIHSMVEALDAAVHLCNDPPDAGPVLTVGRRVCTGKWGWPHIEIEPNYLLQTFRESGNSAYREVSTAADCCGRSVRRQCQDYGHLVRGEPVYTEEAAPEEGGESRRRFHGRGRPLSSTLTDEQLDAFLIQCLQDFLKFGRRKIAGYLREQGQHVPDHCIRESYVRIVIHTFVDGKSHLVTGIQASNNNRGTTVLLLFHRCRLKHGTPSRLRGDHGTENLRRLWYDVTHDFGMKWKDFFLELEVHYSLDPSNHHHIWLLHYLWLDVINRDAQDWMGMWNSHRMTLPRSLPWTPREMFRSSMITDGP